MFADPRFELQRALMRHRNYFVTNVSEPFQVRIYGSASPALGVRGRGDLNGMHLPEQLILRGSGTATGWGVCKHAGSDLRQHTQATLCDPMMEGLKVFCLSNDSLSLLAGMFCFILTLKLFHLCRLSASCEIFYNLTKTN